MCWNWLFWRKKEEEKRKKKILLGTLIPISLVVIGLSILLGCLFGCKESTIFILKDENSVTQYLKKYKSVHKRKQHFNGSNLTQENKQYIYDNFNGQNILNGMIAWNFCGSNEVWHWDSLYGSKWEIKHGKNWASIKALDNSYDKSDLPPDIWQATRYARVEILTGGYIWVERYSYFPSSESESRTLLGTTFTLDLWHSFPNVTPTLVQINPGNTFFKQQFISLQPLFSDLVRLPSQPQHLGNFDSYIGFSNLDYPNVDVI